MALVEANVEWLLRTRRDLDVAAAANERVRLEAVGEDARHGAAGVLVVAVEEPVVAGARLDDQRVVDAEARMASLAGRDLDGRRRRWRACRSHRAGRQRAGYRPGGGRGDRAGSRDLLLVAAGGGQQTGIEIEIDAPARDEVVLGLVARDGVAQLGIHLIGRSTAPLYIARAGEIGPDEAHALARTHGVKPLARFGAIGRIGLIDLKAL